MHQKVTLFEQAIVLADEEQHKKMNFAVILNNIEDQVEILGDPNETGVDLESLQMTLPGMDDLYSVEHHFQPNADTVYESISFENNEKDRTSLFMNNVQKIKLVNLLHEDVFV